MKIFGLEIDSRKIAFVLIFSVLSLALYQYNFSRIIGVESQAFTLFQFIGPIGGAIIGPFGGVLSVLLVEISNFLINGKALEPITIVRFFPMAFAALYFSNKWKTSFILPLFCMVLFWLHPNGAQAWFYALYWVIPAAAAFYKNNLFARSLGATFTAHSIGSVAFLYAFNLPAEVWVGLIPIVAMERLAFAAGISISFYAMNTVLDILSSKINLSSLNIEKKYALLHQ